MNPFYLYTGGVLKRVERERPEFVNAFDSNDHDENDQIREDYEKYISSLPSIQVSDDLKKVWKENQRYEPGKDFMFTWWNGKNWVKSEKPIVSNDILRAATFKEANFYHYKEADYSAADGLISEQEGKQEESQEKHIKLFSGDLTSAMDRILRDKGASNKDVLDAIPDAIRELSAYYLITKI